LSKFRDLSINTKLTVIIISSCLLVSLMASGFFIISEIVSVRRSVLEDLSGLARVIGINVQAPLEFMDPDTATEVLSSLSARPHILQARVYTPDGRLFASYLSPSIPPEEIEEISRELRNKDILLGEKSYRFEKRHIDLTVPLGAQEKQLGTIILQADNSAFHAILTRLLFVVSGILIATLLLALFLSRILSRFVSRPVLSLAGTMETICRQENYSVRAEKISQDELGVLVAGINSMLDGIERRDEQLLVAKQAAEDANRAKSRFLAQMSHEIRTPMNGVIGIASLLLKTSLDDKQRKFVHTICRSGESLLSLINDILDFSKIEAGKLELEKLHFNLRQLAEETIDLFSNRADEQEVRLSCFVYSAVPAYVVGDPGRLRQVLMNLLGNALKFTRLGEVSLRVFLESDTVDNDVHLRFEVSDSGIGISQDKQREIFTAFSQADGSTTRRFGGTGLGLAICHQLVQMMGGRIGVESKEGQGSTFWFTALFPLGSFHESVAAPDDTQPGRDETFCFNACVLVAEDNVTNQIVAQGMLEQLGCSVDIVDNGKEAVTVVAAKNYDFIFMDCQMPVMDGYEATSRIRQMEKKSGAVRIPIIALTAHAMKGDREHCLAVGMDDYLVKPFTEQQLATILGKWFGDKGKQTEIGREQEDNTPEPILKAMQSHIDERVLNNYRSIQQAGKPDIVKRLVGIYLNNSPGVLQEIRKAAESKDTEKLWQSAHSLKSSSANIGATSLAFLCEDLESMGREKQVDKALQTVAVIEEEFRAVAVELGKIISD
jgi:signal transduction histidine kinase/CheY-like chemotaxis protein